MNPINGMLFWFFVGDCVLLTWIGTCPVEEPFVAIGQYCTIFYFFYFFVGMPGALYCWWWWVRKVFIGVGGKRVISGSQ